MVTPDSALPFAAEFQRKLVKLAALDDAFCTKAIKYVTPPMFESDSLRWCWSRVLEERKAGRTPTMLVLHDKLRGIEPVLRDRYGAMLAAIDQEVLREDGYIRHALAEWVRRNMFVVSYEESRKLYSAGKPDDAIDLLHKATEKMQQVTFTAANRFWFYADLGERQRVRRQEAERDWENTYPTGIVGVDEVLDGGLSRGELGCWMGDAKAGKSLMLLHLAASASRGLQRKVLLILLEGSYKQTGARLDSWHAGIAYRAVKRGNFDAKVYQRLQHEYQQAKERLVIRMMTDSWSYSAADVRTELDDCRAQYGWRPDLIVVDYGDLLRSQEKAFSEEEHQRNAFSDLKTLTQQDGGYAIWSATQARRPTDPVGGKKKKDEPTPTYRYGKPVLMPKDIGESYNKVRRVDFLGSINQDEADKQEKLARLMCCLYRDGPAEKLVTVRQDLDRMLFVDLLDPLNRPDSADAIRAKLDKEAVAALDKAKP